jgi:nucleoside-diphosphate-sugar epimerase
LIFRPGLIGGPGDASDRSGAWIARSAEAPTTPLLVPESPSSFVQVLDVRDLAAFIISALAESQTGTFNTVGEETPFSDFVETSRYLGGHVGDVRYVPRSQLQGFGIGEWAGPDSFACFVADPEMAGWGRVDGRKAKGAGLRLRSLEATLSDTLEDERARGLGRRRRAGLSLHREQEVLSNL